MNNYYYYIEAIPLFGKEEEIVKFKESSYHREWESPLEAGSYDGLGVYDNKNNNHVIDASVNSRGPSLHSAVHAIGSEFPNITFYAIAFEFDRINLSTTCFNIIIHGEKNAIVKQSKPLDGLDENANILFDPDRLNLIGTTNSFDGEFKYQSNYFDPCTKVEEYWKPS